ncbi:MAG: ECF transporter S component [Lachnospiraceae bacterium]|nr:ECF transporter S component [Lachnospiraceae bacterium]
MLSKNSKVQKLVGTAILVGIVIVLQAFASGIHFGPFTPTLALIPIIIGAILFGPGAGALLGLIFGIIVVITVVSGLEPFSLIMFNQNPVFTVATCLVKGAAAGFFAGIVYKALQKHKYVGVAVAALIAPIANTGLFALAMLTVFRNLLVESAAGQNPVVFLLVAFIGVNFLFELAFDIILTPVIIRIISAVKKTS